MCQGDVEATRSTKGGDTRTGLDSRAYTVWLHAVHKFYDAEKQNGWMRTGTQSRLQELFDLVAKKGSKIKKIDVTWTDDVGKAGVKDNEIVIYFVTGYTDGLIKKYIADRLKQNLTEAERKTYDDAAATQSKEGAKEAGLALIEIEWSLSEVYIAMCKEASPADPDATNYEELVTKWQARMAGNAAFHEAMHNKIDPTQGSSWDLHAKGGDGLAKATFGEKTNHTDANIQQMADALPKDRKQYILGQTKLPPDKPKTEAKTEAKPQGDADFQNLEVKW
jgi:hypothetical protein